MHDLLGSVAFFPFMLLSRVQQPHQLCLQYEYFPVLLSLHLIKYRHCSLTTPQITVLSGLLFSLFMKHLMGVDLHILQEALVGNIWRQMGSHSPVLRAALHNNIKLKDRQSNLRCGKGESSFTELQILSAFLDEVVCWWALCL